MNDQMIATEIPLGSFWFWLMGKLVTVLILVAAPMVALYSQEFVVPMRFIFVGINYALIILSNEELAYGHAGEDGIHYRRYFRTQFLPWSAIASIRWSSRHRINFSLKQGFLFRKTLAMQSVGSRFSPESFSEPPEVVRWLLFARPEGANGIVLEGPGL